MALAISLRDEPLPSGAHVVVHMGAGDPVRLVQTAVNNYGYYRSIHPDSLGYFAVSVFAVLGSVTIDTILAGMPHGQYATCRSDRLLAAFQVLPTIISTPAMTGEAAALQNVHFDVVLAPPDPAALAEIDPIDDDTLAVTCTNALLSEAHRLTRTFDSRHRNPLR